MKSFAYLSIVFAISSFLPTAAQTAPRWAPDGVHLMVGTRWVDPTSGEEVEAKATPAVEDPRGPLLDALRAKIGGRLPEGRTNFGTLPRAPEPATGVRVAANGQVAAIVANGRLLVARAGEVRTFGEGLDGVRRFDISGDGSAVSYIQGHDLYVTRTTDGQTFRLSEDGGENLFYGELDWVYQEEVYGRGDFQGAWWSPQQPCLAYVRIDENGVDTFTVVDHIPNQLGIEQLKYPKAGSTNPRATLHVADAANGTKIAVDLSGYPAEAEILVVRVGWNPEGDRVVFMIQNREQTWLDLNFADPKTGKMTTILHEECKDGWVNVLSFPHWLKDGTFLWESERTGFKHLYHYDRVGKLLAAVTSGEWEVRSVLRIDEERSNVTFYGSRESAVGLHAYRATLDGRGFARLTKGRGTHAISLNGDGSLLIDSYSSLESPPETWLRKEDGSDVRALSRGRTTNPDPSSAELVQATCRDGEVLDATISRPKDFDPTKKYPIWIDTYSGPDSATVRDAWRGRRGNDFYADNGIILFQVNVRSASGRGMKYTKQCYRQFGVQELKDLEDAVAWLTKNYSWADADRVGISGWSYGGFMAAFALTHSKIFKCGIAGAGVYGWELYDTIYTERYMAKPQNNPDGYRKSSVVDAAGDLHGQLLIVHGTMDDNVHLQNAVQFLHGLQRAGKQNFTFMMYPKSRHGVGSPHLGELRRRFVLEHL